jgi:hypothetical protein
MIGEIRKLGSLFLCSIKDFRTLSPALSFINSKRENGRNKKQNLKI